MAGNRARRRAAKTGAVRQDDSIPLIEDKTELITPELAQAMLKNNESNRPVAWRKVEEYANLMAAGKWELHAQGIILDAAGNILTGQKRLWAIIYADTPIYMRVSRGSPVTSAALLDRGTPQSARDLASRKTNRKHSPVESSIARAVLAACGNVKPSKDDLAKTIAECSERAQVALAANRGAKKTRGVLMILGAICLITKTPDAANQLARATSALVETLEIALLPHTPKECWGKGAAFGLAMDHAMRIVSAGVK